MVLRFLKTWRARVVGIGEFCFFVNRFRQVVVVVGQVDAPSLQFRLREVRIANLEIHPFRLRVFLLKIELLNSFRWLNYKSAFEKKEIRYF